MNTFDKLNGKQALIMCSDHSYRHGMGLRKNCEQRVHGMIHSKQLSNASLSNMSISRKRVHYTDTE